MKLLVVLMLCAAAVAAPSIKNQKQLVPGLELPTEVTPENRNILVNMLVRQLIAYIRLVINQGSSLFGIPPLDPLELDQFSLNIPAGLINLALDLEDVYVTGFGGFVVHTSDLNLRDFTFDLDISFPLIDIRSGKYDFLGDLFTAIPLYGKGDAAFRVENFRFQAKLFLGQSEDEQSVVITRIEDASFQMPHFDSKLTGVIGGGDIDAIVNAIVEDVLIGYVNRFQGAIALVASHAVVIGLNPILEQLDTWRFIAPFV